MSSPFDGKYVFQYTLNHFRVSKEDRANVFQCVVNDCPSYEWARAEAYKQRPYALERFNALFACKLQLTLEDVEAQAIPLNVVLCDLMAREMRTPDGKPFTINVGAST